MPVLGALAVTAEFANDRGKVFQDRFVKLDRKL